MPSTHPGDPGERPSTGDAAVPSERPDALAELRTHRLVILDDRNDERIVAEVEPDGTAAVRVSLPHDDGQDVSVVLYACPDPGAAVGEDLGSAVGLQCWAAGDSHAECNLWMEDGHWAARLSVGGPGPDGVDGPTGDGGAAT